MWGQSLDTPLGRLRLVCRADALVGVYFPEHTPPPRYVAQDGRHPILHDAAQQLTDWCAGRRTTFELPIAMDGTPFQLDVWSALCQIPFGETRSYGALAAAMGRPTAARAVGAAVGRNPLAIVIPCHRVMGAGGRLTGFAGGLSRKRWLLERETSRGLERKPRSF